MAALDEIEDSVVGEEDVAHVPAPKLPLRGERVTLGERTQTRECSFEHRVPHLGVTRSNLAFLLQFAKPPDVLLGPPA
jgi:hypothetical protein